MGTKICSKCKKEKDIDSFCKNQYNKDGHNYYCRNCAKIQYDDYRSRHKERLGEYRKSYTKEHKEEIKIKRRTYYPRYRESNRTRAREYYSLNKEKIKQKNRDNREKINEKLRNYRNSNINIKISNNLRNRIFQSIKGYEKGGSLCDLIGCTVEYLKQYLESLFKDNMSWDNYGYSGWHIDHIIPCAAFDLSDVNEQRECFNYKNMQPLWANENISKNSFYNGEKVYYKDN